MDAKDKIIEDLQKLVASQSKQMTLQSKEIAKLTGASCGIGTGVGQSDKRLINIIETAVQ